MVTKKTNKQAKRKKATKRKKKKRGNSDSDSTSSSHTSDNDSDRSFPSHDFRLSHLDRLCRESSFPCCWCSLVSAGSELDSDNSKYTKKKQLKAKKAMKSRKKKGNVDSDSKKSSVSSGSTGDPELTRAVSAYTQPRRKSSWY